MKPLRTTAKEILGSFYGLFRGAWCGSRFLQLCAAGFVTVGRHSYGVPDVHTFRGNSARLEIGAFSSIADGVTILLGGDHPTRWVSTFPFRARLHLPGAFRDGVPACKGDVRIGSDVWIAHGVTILSGVTIGDGAIIGAGALVATDIPPYAIALGLPARVCRFRFEPATVAALREIRWWDWPQDRIEDAIDLLSSDRIDEFLEFADQSSSYSRAGNTI